MTALELRRLKAQHAVMKRLLIEALDRPPTAAWRAEARDVLANAPEPPSPYRWPVP